VVRLHREGAAAIVTVSDAGVAFDPREAAFDGPNHVRGGGAGLALIASLARITRYKRRRGRNRLTLELPL
jgi:anti-sigma regulatory factor (Ser/Thr protein kinase)